MRRPELTLCRRELQSFPQLSRYQKASGDLYLGEAGLSCEVGLLIATLIDDGLVTNTCWLFNGVV
jgi:hypothetical protein